MIDIYHFQFLKNSATSSDLFAVKRYDFPWKRLQRHNESD